MSRARSPLRLQEFGVGLPGFHQYRKCREKHRNRINRASMSPKDREALEFLGNEMHALKHLLHLRSLTTARLSSLVVCVVNVCVVLDMWLSQDLYGPSNVESW